MLNHISSEVGQLVRIYVYILARFSCSDVNLALKMSYVFNIGRYGPDSECRIYISIRGPTFSYSVIGSGVSGRARGLLCLFFFTMLLGMNF